MIPVNIVSLIITGSYIPLIKIVIIVEKKISEIVNNFANFQQELIGVTIRINNKKSVNYLF